MSRCTIGLIDPVPLLRLGVETYLSASVGAEVLWHCDQPAQALGRLVEQEPDLIISEAVFPCSQSVLNLLEDLLSRGIRVPVFTYSCFDEHLLAPRILQRGGKGYLMKNTPVQELADAVETVLAGKISLSAAMTELVINSLGPGKAADLHRDSLPGLTNRELEVFELIGGGMKSCEIASTLGISIRTVDTHRSRIREKLGISHGISLVAFACQWMTLQQAEAGSVDLVARP